MLWEPERGHGNWLNDQERWLAEITDVTLPEFASFLNRSIRLMGGLCRSMGEERWECSNLIIVVVRSMGILREDVSMRVYSW